MAVHYWCGRLVNLLEKFSAGILGSDLEVIDHTFLKLADSQGRRYDELNGIVKI